MTIIDSFKKWLFRTWSDWEPHGNMNTLDINYKILHNYLVLKSISNDGLVKFKRIRI